MNVMGYIGYGLLILYGLYCFVFWACVLYTLAIENRYTLQNFLPARNARINHQVIYE
jgi:hypothetical protein